ncbi:MAG TPA: hypothetical protein VD883_01420, partial [Candidatus Omnitrophota bacterium]|nr:hypothetical protein [Candidatus Omnitrophota bacterium]
MAIAVIEGNKGLQDQNKQNIQQALQETIDFIKEASKIAGNENLDQYVKDLTNRLNQSEQKLTEAKTKTVEEEFKVFEEVIEKVVNELKDAKQNIGQEIDTFKDKKIFDTLKKDISKELDSIYQEGQKIINAKFLSGKGTFHETKNEYLFTDSEGNDWYISKAVMIWGEDSDYGAGPKFDASSLKDYAQKIQSGVGNIIPKMEKVIDDMASFYVNVTTKATTALKTTYGLQQTYREKLDTNDAALIKAVNEINYLLVDLKSEIIPIKEIDEKIVESADSLSNAAIGKDGFKASQDWTDRAKAFDDLDAKIGDAQGKLKLQDYMNIVEDGHSLMDDIFGKSPTEMGQLWALDPLTGALGSLGTSKLGLIFDYDAFHTGNETSEGAPSGAIAKLWSAGSALVGYDNDPLTPSTGIWETIEQEFRHLLDPHAGLAGGSGGPMGGSGSVTHTHYEAIYDDHDDHDERQGDPDENAGAFHARNEEGFHNRAKALNELRVSSWKFGWQHKDGYDIAKVVPDQNEQPERSTLEGVLADMKAIPKVGDDPEIKAPDAAAYFGYKAREKSWDFVGKYKKEDVPDAWFDPYFGKGYTDKAPGDAKEKQALEADPYGLGSGKVNIKKQAGGGVGVDAKDAFGKAYETAAKAIGKAYLDESVKRYDKVLGFYKDLKTQVENSAKDLINNANDAYNNDKSKLDAIKQSQEKSAKDAYDKA